MPVRDLRWRTAADRLSASRRGLSSTVAVAGHLIDTFGRVNQQFAKGWNALMLAIAHLQTETVRLLLARGADVTLKNADGTTPLSQATELLRSVGKGPLTAQCEDIINQLRSAG